MDILTDSSRYAWGTTQQFVAHAKEILKSQTTGNYICINCTNSFNTICFIFASWHLGIIPVLINPKFPQIHINSIQKDFNCKTVLQTDDHTLTPIPNKTEYHLNPEQISSIIFSSGSTGTPKAITHKISNHIASAKGSHTNIPISSNNNYLLTLPLYHVSGLSILFKTHLANATLTISNKSLNQAIETHKPSHISLVASQLQELCDHTQTHSSLKHILLGGSQISEHLIQKAYSSYPTQLHTSYGSSEMSAQITCTPPHSSLETLTQTSGKCLLQRQIKISTDKEILVKGETLFMGYHEDGLFSKETDIEGWFATGDIGHFNSQNDLIVTGRKDNMFISGGENIYPEEIEQALTTIDTIETAIVIPKKHPKYQERPIAYIKTNSKLTKNLKVSIKTQLQKTLPKFKIPDELYDWPIDAPKTFKSPRAWFIQNLSCDPK